MDSSNNISQIVKEAANPWSIGVDLVVILVVVGVVLFGFFYLLKKYLIPLLESVKERKKTKLLIFRIEVVIWLAFALFALTQLFMENIWITTALVVIIGLAGIQFWRDFFPGLLLRVTNKFRQGDPVRFRDYTGVISQLGKTSLLLKTGDEELVFIPYRKITDEVFIKRQAKGRLMSAKVILQIGQKNPDQVIQHVNNWMVQCPWAVSHSAGLVSVQPGGLLNVTVYAVDIESLGKVERFLKARYDALA